jgi:hypothetical protein
MRRAAYKVRTAATPWVWQATVPPWATGVVPSSFDSVMGIRSRDDKIGSGSAVGAGIDVLNTGGDIPSTGDGGGGLPVGGSDNVCLRNGGGSVLGASILVTGNDDRSANGGDGLGSNQIATRR